MYETTQTFDRVFDVKNQTKGRFGRKDTLFGFEAAGKRQFGAQVPEWPRLKNGMTVTAWLRRQGDWTSIAGWVDHDSGEIVVTASLPHFLYALYSLSIAGTCLFLALSSSSWSDSLLPMSVKEGVCAVPAFFALFYVREGLAIMRLRKRLEHRACSIK